MTINIAVTPRIEKIPVSLLKIAGNFPSEYFSLDLELLDSREFLFTVSVLPDCDYGVQIVAKQGFLKYLFYEAYAGSSSDWKKYKSMKEILGEFRDWIAESFDIEPEQVREDFTIND
ncbi:hypothetical protein NIES4101_83510 [Calothrix sp. NIES-4101]|nr:hypothetical protein NIES4101_83510 [Calothrix sp. NIES-4101]